MEDQVKSIFQGWETYVCLLKLKERDRRKLMKLLEREETTREERPVKQEIWLILDLSYNLSRPIILKTPFVYLYFIA